MLLKLNSTNAHRILNSTKVSKTSNSTKAPKTSNSTYYLFVGKATAYTSSTTGGSDSTPPAPADAPGDTEFYAWD